MKFCQLWPARLAQNGGLFHVLKFDWTICCIIVLSGIADPLSSTLTDTRVQLHTQKTLLLQHVTVFYFSMYLNKISPGLQASIGVTCSYSSCPFLCALAHHNTWSPWLCFQGSPLYDVNLEPRFGWGNKKKCLVYTVCACACQHTYVYVQTRLPWNSVANKHLCKQYIPGSLSPLPLPCLGTRLVWCVRWWKA